MPSVEMEKIDINLVNQTNFCNDKLTSCDEVDDNVFDKFYLIINYLPSDVDENDIQKIFGECGEIESLLLARDKQSFECLGYGFVRYKSESSAANAIKKLNKLPYGNKVLKVSYARPKYDCGKNSKLYITNLPENYEQSDVVSLFSQFGKIIECRLLEKKENRVGVAFVIFKDYSDAQNACALDGVILNGSKKILHVKFADSSKKNKQLGSVTNTPSPINSISNDDSSNAEKELITPKVSPRTSRSNSNYFFGNNSYGRLIQLQSNVVSPISYNNYNYQNFQANGISNPNLTVDSSILANSTTVTYATTVFIDNILSEIDVNLVINLSFSFVLGISTDIEYVHIPVVYMGQYYHQLRYRCKIKVRTYQEAAYLISKLRSCAIQYPYLNNLTMYYNNI